MWDKLMWDQQMWDKQMWDKQMWDKQMWDQHMTQKYASLPCMQLAHADHLREAASRSAYRYRGILTHGEREYLTLSMRECHTLPVYLWTLSLMPINLQLCESCERLQPIVFQSVISSISNLDSMCSFSRSRLPRSLAKRPRRLRLEMKMEWHSKCNRLQHIMCASNTY